MGVDVDTQGNQNNQSIHTGPEQNFTFDSRTPSGKPSDKKLGFGPGNPVWYQDTLSSAIEKGPEVSEPAAKDVSFFSELITKMINKIKPKNKIVQETEALAISLGNKLEDMKEEAAEEFEQTKDPLTGLIVQFTEKLENELRKDKLDWHTIDTLVRHLAIILAQKMLKNDHNIIQEELKLLRQDITNIQKTYNTKWEVGLGVTLGVLNIGAGLIGMGTGVAAMGGAIASSTLKTIQGITSGAQAVGQGGQYVQGFFKNSAEEKRQLAQYQKELNTGHKSAAETAQHATKSARGSQSGQVNNAIEAGYRAFTQMAS